MLRRSCLSLSLAIAGLVSTPATAHDTWFDVQPGPRAGQIDLKLGTGTQFPAQQYTVAAGLLARQGCRHGDAAVVPMVVPMVALESIASALHLQGRPVVGAQRGQSGAMTCWAQLQPLDIEIDPVKVQVYLDEIAASPELRRTWRQMQARGLPWKERYTKHARVEVLDPRLGGGDAPAARAVPMDMDIVLESGLDRLQAGDTIRVQVLRDGQPLPDFPLQLRSDRSALGLWLRTDAQGRAHTRVPLAGSWLLRGTDLRLSTQRPDAWDSRFVTLAFDVAAAPR
jgi:hypothetical protein